MSQVEVLRNLSGVILVWHVRSGGEVSIFGSAGRLASFKRLLADARERLGLDIRFVLWDGSTIPVDWPATRLAIALADEGVLAGLVRRPNLDTVANVWASGRVDIRNGTIFDLAAIRPRVRTREFRKNLDKWLAISTLAKFFSCHAADRGR